LTLALTLTHKLHSLWPFLGGQAMDLCISCYLQFLGGDAY